MQFSMLVKCYCTLTVTCANHNYNLVSPCVRPNKKIYVFTVTCQKNLGSVGLHFNFFFFLIFIIGKTGNSHCQFQNPIPVFHFQNFREAVTCWSCFYKLWRVVQFFYLLCSQFRQKASGWINNKNGYPNSM
jgi:hypothetical protein